jgi:putative transposase
MAAVALELRKAGVSAVVGRDSSRRRKSVELKLDLRSGRHSGCSDDSDVISAGLASRPTGMNDPKTNYRRHLPHYQPSEAMYHVVFRLAGSLPVAAIESLRLEREQAERAIEKAKSDDEKKRLMQEYRWSYFERFDELLDGNSAGPHWLREPTVASIVKEALHYRDGKEYDLLAYCIMPNHVHIVCSIVGRSGTPSTEQLNRAEGRNDIPTYNAKPMFRILQSLKRHTARKSNAILKRSGAFWQDESYDHVIRDDNELERTISYVLNNPVKARLVQSWEQWPWTYVKPALL